MEYAGIHDGTVLGHLFFLIWGTYLFLVLDEEPFRQAGSQATATQLIIMVIAG
jgi:hypothetical protein